MENKDQSAFPFESEVTDNYGAKYKQIQSFGLTKLEYFAGLAMQGILAANPNCYWGNRDGQCVSSEIAKDAIEHAKELLTQLKKEHGK